MEQKAIVRGIVVVLVTLSLLTLTQGYVTYGEEASPLESEADAEQIEHRADGITVVTTSERLTNGKRDNALIAYDADGEIVYYNDSHRVYNDIDPLPAENATFLYVAANRLDRSECRATAPCWRNVVEEVNLTTGEVTRVYSRITALGRGQWHDVDRIDESRLLVADIALDRVFVVNTTTGLIEWEWDAQSAYPLRGGGLFPGDWTHVNDVDVLEDGRVMASLRNQDQVVFIDRQSGLQENWTLGAEDDYSVLYEQHNPDYIPRERGGPAVVVADSENNRIAEFQRSESGEWEQTWEWSDIQLAWPRDADRLPNGNTLVTDSNGARVLEVNPEGQVVWSVEIKGAYDAERLGTGDGSAGGYAASSDSHTSQEGQSAESEKQTQSETPQSGDAGPVTRVLSTIKGFVPALVMNPILYVLPPWIGFVEFLALLLLLATVVGWGLLELRWSDYSIRIERGRSGES